MRLWPKKIRPEDLEGATVLVGIQRLRDDGDGNFEEHVCSATVRLPDADGVIIVELLSQTGVALEFPFFSGAFDRAKPGKYHCSNNIMTAENPDFTVCWSVNERSKN